MKRLRPYHTALIEAFFVTIVLAVAANAAVIRVKPGGNDANTGADWASAKKTVTAAIAAANQGDQIWVALGTYQEHIRNRSVGGIAVDVALYGGFAGTETALNQRNPTVNVTTLDGGGGDFPVPPTQGAVIFIDSGAGPETRVDGFTIVRGHGIHGGGIKTVASGPTIANNVIRANVTDGAGAGISVWGFRVLPEANTIIVNNAIVENSSVNSEGDGGGVAVVGASAIITNNYIARNEVTRNGGGIAVWRNSLPLIANNLIVANSAGIPQVADTEAGTMGIGGGIFASATDLDYRPIEDALTAPVILNNVVAVNGAFTGGGISVINSILPFEVPKIINNTVLSNHGAGIYFSDISPIIKNNLVVYNTWGVVQLKDQYTNPTIASNDVFGNLLRGARSDYDGINDLTGTDGNLSVDPAIASVNFGRFHLQPGSPVIGAGSNAAVNDAYDTLATRYPGVTFEQKDIDMQPRVAGTVDIGADESNGDQWPSSPTIAYVRPGGNNGNDGLSWQAAKATIQAAIAVAQQAGGEVWAAGGTYAERITLPAYVYLYGGFSGNEAARSARDIAAHPTIIDGGGVSPVVMIANAGYLVSALDGFTIQNGGHYSSGVIPPLGGGNQIAALGGGIRSRVASPTLANNLIRRNSVGNPFNALFAKGGGIALYQSHAVMENNTLTENEVLAMDGFGGAIYCVRSLPWIDGNTFLQNHGRRGAAISCTNANPWITGNTVKNNNMYDWYGLINGAVQGAISLNLSPDFLIQGNMIQGNSATGSGAGICVQSNFAGSIRDNLITGNAAVDPHGTGGMGGGIYADVPPNATDNLLIVNNTIVDNSAGFMLGIGHQGGGIALSLLTSLPPPPQPPPPKIVIANNIVAFNSSGLYETLTYPQLQPTLIRNDVFNTAANYTTVTPGQTDISVDPVFVNRAGGNLHLGPSSPCIDAGNNSAVPASLTTDFDGNPRIWDGNRDGNAVADMGAYEVYQPAPNPVDFDGDHKGDISVFRPASGTWFVLPSSSPGSYLSAPWGMSGDQAVQGDYDGDGKVDYAIWRPSSGTWYILPSGTPGTYTAKAWGLPTDLPVPADYDGDGKTDVAVWRPGSGIWYILPSNSPGTFTTATWGSPTDVPVPADYDGDGKADVAVWRPGSGIWYILPSNSPGTYIGRPWGMLNDVPVPGDYDGDRKTDIAVWRPDSGTWYVLPSTAPGNYTSTLWGLPTDVPAPADYDGDGKADIAVWRPGSGIWYVLPSGTPGSYLAKPWGVSSDIPLSPVTLILAATP